MVLSNINIFEYLGIILVLLILTIILLATTAVVLGYYLIKKNKILFPKLSLYITNNFYSILLKIFLLVGTEDTFYKVASEFYNRYYCESFKKAKNKILILPHCLRDLKCPGKLGVDGIECLFCSKCPVGEIIKVAKENGYEVYIVPGSTFLKRLVKEKNPDGVFAVACYNDLFHGMNSLSRKNIPIQGQLLMKDGCILTLVDVEELINRLKNKPC
ncbi:protein of unknown function DUF116 [Methanococcus vannielii SB]|jgi:hypothetical protein|uniref:DUF116 domain-containing protein n=1 Tax=Methanococcus vannielii (strain ATCC 35089 / DSM 1224 / JCM 13029 / OCM 148 / SB) TaxID=406327 RepID=A6URE3_METVS|nr:DUF116 domain-containing protein [Methanococcus vannielii]ABR55065.1 protein of unknown function DUF116 [Methanococcus vannielii SB]